MKLITIIFSVFNALLCFSQPNWMVEKLYGFVPIYKVQSIQYPVNNGSMKGYTDAKPFGTKEHLGSDINGIKTGNSDLGDTIYSIGNGKVIYLWEMNYSENRPGSVIMILHNTKDGYRVSLYRHCQTSFVKWGQYIAKNQPISTFGTDGGLYYAHLHFEIRDNVLMGIGPGYGNSAGFLDPMKFIAEYNK